MIAITALAEPVTVNAPVNEPQQIRKNDENETPSESFEEILAGIVHDQESSVNSPQKLNETPAVEHFCVITGDNLEVLSEQEFSGINLTQENLNAQTGLNDNMFAGLLDAEETNDLLSDLSYDELALKNDFSSVGGVNNQELNAEKALFASQKGFETSSAKNSEDISSVATAKAAAKAAEEIAAEKRAAAGEKTEVNSKNENTETLSSLKKSANENKNEFSHNKKESNDGERLVSRSDDKHSRSRRDRISFEIRDQRTMTDNTQMRFTSVETAAGKMPDASIKDITLELRLPDYNNAGQNAQTTWEVKASTALENMLARELHQNFNGDIVRHASMALRDGGESIIKLNLRPESLGNVKIKLEMTDNKITGVILVESEEALNAFRKELASLEQAFKESGFADANLDLSLAGDGKNAWQENEENALSSQIAALHYEDSLRDSSEIGRETFDFYERDRAGYVNMLA